MNRIFITSDLHFGHDQLFIYGPRGFTNYIDADETVIKNWNATVDNDDIVYILGDLMLGDNDYGMSCLNRLNGKFHVILGNHDTEARIELYKTCEKILSVQYATRLRYGKYHFYLSHYPTLTSEYKPLKAAMINCCGHTHTPDKFIDFKYGMCYHCELDAHNNKPILLDQVIEDLRNKLEEIENN